MITAVDLNCDMGEGYGPYAYGNDEAMLDFVSSANIACGFHAGDPRLMGETVALAIEKGVGVGAHPSFPDRVGFGRRDMVMTPDEISTDLLYQLGALDAFCRSAGTTLRHVKPHGALYNTIVHHPEQAAAVAAAARSGDVVLTMGAGDVTMLGKEIVTELGIKANRTVPGSSSTDSP